MDVGSSSGHDTHTAERRDHRTRRLLPESATSKDGPSIHSYLQGKVECIPGYLVHNL